MEPKKNGKVTNLQELKDYQRELVESPDNEDKILQILSALDKIIPVYKDIKDSKIAKTISQLYSSKNKEISVNAHALIEKWKKIIKRDSKKEKNNEKKIKDENNKNKDNTSNKDSSVNKDNNNKDKNKPNAIENSSDKNKNILEEVKDYNIDDSRNGMRKLILNSLLKKIPEEYNKETLKDIVIQVENKMHELLDTQSKYISRGKSLVSNISDAKNEEFRKLILSGELTPEKLVTMNVSDMATQQMKNERTKKENEIFESLRSDWNDLHTPAFEGMYKCFKCGGKRTSSKEFQMRSADEPMTIFIRCIDCGNEWRIG